MKPILDQAGRTPPKQPFDLPPAAVATERTLLLASFWLRNEWVPQRPLRVGEISPQESHA